MLHYPHVIAPHSESAINQHVAPSDCCLNIQLSTAPPQYLCAVIICCLFNTLLYPGDVRALVHAEAIDDRGTTADIIGKVRYVRAVMTYH